MSRVIRKNNRFARRNGRRLRKVSGGHCCCPSGPKKPPRPDPDPTAPCCECKTGIARCSLIPIAGSCGASTCDYVIEGRFSAVANGTENNNGLVRNNRPAVVGSISHRYKDDFFYTFRPPQCGPSSADSHTTLHPDPGPIHASRLLTRSISSFNVGIRDCQNEPVKGQDPFSKSFAGAIYNPNWKPTQGGTAGSPIPPFQFVRHLVLIDASVSILRGWFINRELQLIDDFIRLRVLASYDMLTGDSIWWLGCSRGGLANVPGLWKASASVRPVGSGDCVRGLGVTYSAEWDLVHPTAPWIWSAGNIAGAGQAFIASLGACDESEGRARNMTGASVGELIGGIT